MNYVSLLIDQGYKYKNKGYIEKGIKRGEELYKKIPKNETQRICKLFYFLGNGYFSLFKLNEKYNLRKFSVGNDFLIKSKKFYRRSIENSNNSTKILKKRLWTNYGNCLQNLGRGVEAFYAYGEALKIDSEFGLALLNKQIAIISFAKINMVYGEDMYAFAYQNLKKIEENERMIENIISIGGREAINGLKREISEIESKFSVEELKKNVLQNPIDFDSKSKFERFFIDFCLKHSLFLNLNIHKNYCNNLITDSAFVRGLSTKGNIYKFYDLVNYVNQIKEDYTTSRMFLVLSQFDNIDFDHINDITFYAESPGSSIFNLNSGLLKSAFKESYNILDKISIFLNDYFELGIKKKREVTFFNKHLWRSSDKDWKLKSKILNSNNFGFYALFDVHLDLESGNFKDVGEGDYYFLRKTRNKLIHDKLIIHSDEWDGIEDDYNIKYSNFLKRTIQMIQIIRSAIIYLINAVEYNESKKEYNQFLMNSGIDTIFPDLSNY